MINEVGCCPNTSGDVYFVNNEQALIISECDETNQICSPLKVSPSINAG